MQIAFRSFWFIKNLESFQMKYLSLRKHFVSKLTDADGELQETVHWIETAADCEYLSSDLTLDLKSQCAEIGRLIGGMIAKSALFCKGSDRSVREPVGDYFIDNTSDNW